MNTRTLFISITAVVILALIAVINAGAPLSGGSESTKIAEIAEPEFVEMEYWYHPYYGLGGYVKVAGLNSSTYYLLSLQGKKGRPGNKLLQRISGTWGEDGYYDFKRVKSNNTGYLEADFELGNLPNGEYDVLLTIKESDSGNVVLYDFMNFKIDRWWFLDILGTVVIIIGIIIGIIVRWKYGR